MMVIASLPMACVWFDIALSPVRNMVLVVAVEGDDKHLYINGVCFPMRRLQRGEEQQLWLGNLSVTDRDYETELDTAATSIDRLVRDLSDNLFVSEEDKKSVAQYVSIVRKEIAWARVDMRKLRYGDE